VSTGLAALAAAAVGDDDLAVLLAAVDEGARHDDLTGFCRRCWHGDRGGLPPRAGAGAGRIALDGGTWRRAAAPEDGIPALIFPVFDWIGEGEVRAVDAVAVDPARPSRWLLHRGLADVLGLTPGYGLDDAPALRLFRDPVAWTLAGCTTLGLAGDAAGVVLLAPGSEAAGDLLLGHTLICMDAAHAAEIDALRRAHRRRRRNRMWPRLPAIRVAA